MFLILSEKEADGVLFFDEMNQSSPLVMASLFQIFLDRAIGEISLSNEVGIFSAGNRASVDRANVFEIPSPLKDRMSEVELVVPDINKWNDWALNNKVDGRIIGFLNWKPSRLYNVEKNSADKSSTPRGWYRCSNLIDGITDLEELELISSSAIGEATAIEFSAFIKLQRKVDIKDLLNNPEKIKEIKEIDLKYSLLSSANEYYKLNKKKEVLEKIFRLCNYLEVEFGVLLLRMCKSIDEDFFRKGVREVGEGKQLIKDYAKFII